MASNHLLFFGDQAVETGPFIRELVHKSKTSQTLRQFLRNVENQLRLDVSGLSEDERRLIPPFHSVADLAENRDEATDRGVLSTVLLCIAQLGDLIQRLERDPSILQGTTSNSGAQRRIVGFCTGLLPAAVAAVSTSLLELRHIAQETVSLSLRLVLHARRRSLAIEASPGAWSVVVAGQDATQVSSNIAQHNQHQSIHVHKQIYISSESRSTLTISGSPSILQDFLSRTKLNPTGVLPKHHRLLTAIYEILKDGGLVESRNGVFVRSTRPVATTPSWAIHSQLVRDFPLHACEHELLQVTGTKLAECLTGAADPLSLVFGKSRALLQDFYTNAPMFAAASKLASEVIGRVFAGTNECIEILEVGAGLGGTTRYVLDKLAENNVPFKYTYTDISPSFLAEAKGRYSHLPAGSVEFVPLDIEKSPPEKLQGRFHVVLSSNCIHATRNLVVSCANVRKLLRPGGFLALIEFTTRLRWLDLVFGLLEGWWQFDDNRTYCLVDESIWRTTLEAAGFSNVLWTEPEGTEKPKPQTIVGFYE